MKVHKKLYKNVFSSQCSILIKSSENVYTNIPRQGGFHLQEMKVIMPL